MGIKGLKSFLQDNDINNGVDKTSLNKFKKSTLAVDLSILLHRSLYNNSNYISYFVNFTLKLVKYHITPIFVFDGKPPKEKNGVLELRKKNKNKASKKVSLLLDLKKKIDKIYQLTNQIIIIESINENENKNNEVFVSNTDDTLNRYQYLSKKKIFEKLSLHHELIKNYKIKEYLSLNKCNQIGFIDEEINSNLSNSVMSTDSMISSTDSMISSTDSMISSTDSMISSTDSMISNDSGIISDISIDDYLNNNIQGISSKRSSISLDSISEDDLLDLNLTDLDYTSKYINNMLLNYKDESNDSLTININETHKDIEKDINKDIQKNNNKSKGIKKSYIDNLKKLFNYLHVPYIHMNKEADIVCKLLIDYNIVDSCISDDMDMIPYQCKSIIQNINFSNDNVVVYTLESILENLNISNQQLIDLCICCGTDFNNKLINIKCRELYELIKVYGSIEGIINNLDKINEKREKTLKIPYQFDYQISRNIFMIKDNDITQNYLISKIKNYHLTEEKDIDEVKLKEFYERGINFIKRFSTDWNYFEIILKLNKIYKVTLKKHNNIYNFYSYHYDVSNINLNKKNNHSNIDIIDKFDSIHNLNRIHNLNSIDNIDRINSTNNIDTYFNKNEPYKMLYEWQKVK